MPQDDPQSHELMHCIDGKKGYGKWGKHGYLPAVQPVGWQESLPVGEDGEISLDLQDSVRVARIHSREYQSNLETLYLSALDVTFERFRFDHQFFAGTQLQQGLRGSLLSNGSSSETSLNTGAGFRKLSATGGEAVIGFANSLVWDSWGSDTDLFSSTIDFSLVQPLLRLGGRARVLENLTQSERSLLGNVRQMEQYRQGFYVSVATGRNSGDGPTLRDGVGQNGLGLIAGFPSGRNGAPSAGGYLGLLQTQQQIRNQATNIAALRDSLAQLEAAFDANRITSRLQVDQARQALLNAQSSLLTSRAAYASRVDAFKVELGLPPELPLEIKDTLLDRFILIDPSLTDLQDDLADVLSQIRKRRDASSAEFIAEMLAKVSDLDTVVSEQLSSAESDLVAFNERLPKRKEQLGQVATQIAELDADVDPRVYDEGVMMERVAFLKRRLPLIGEELKANTESRRILFDGAAGQDASQLGSDTDGAGSLVRDQQDESEAWKRLNELATELSDLLLELSLVHAEIRLQGIGLLPISIESTAAVDAARLNRLDWMNARANLVDSWRKIEFVANDLKSDLDIQVDGQIGTRADNVLDFDDDRSRVRLGIKFDTPTARIAERNRYRATLIEYQRARRDYMLFEDRISQSIRNTLRIIKLSQINLEVRRAAVQVAIAQVDIARLRLNPPVRPNQPSRTSPTAARDLVSALTDLLDAQNDLLNVWVSYEVLRVLLDFEMGTMELNPNGGWLDPGPIQQGSSPGIPLTDDFDSDLGQALQGGLSDAMFIEIVPPQMMQAEAGLTQ